MMNEQLEQFEDALFLAQAKGLIEVNEKVTSSLIKKGIKLRKYKWQELEAS